MAVVLVRMKGWKVVPLKRTAEAFPNPGIFNEPVIINVWLAETRLEDAWFLLRDRTCRPRMFVPLPKVSPTEFQFLPSNFIKKAVPFVAVPATQS